VNDTRGDPADPNGGGGGAGGAPAGPLAGTVPASALNNLTFDLKPLRQQGMGEDDSAPRDGDLTPWVLANGITCGVMYKTSPVEAAFVLCGNRLLAGPLTAMTALEGALTQLEQEMSAAAGKDAAAVLAIVERTMRAKWMTSCTGCRYRIYDDRGNHLRDE
jgi:hypothetical protein